MGGARAHRRLTAVWVRVGAYRGRHLVPPNLHAEYPAARARMAELADAADLKFAAPLGCTGSSPVPGTRAAAGGPYAGLLRKLRLAALPKRHRESMAEAARRRLPGPHHQLDTFESCSGTQGYCANRSLECPRADYGATN